MDAIEANHASVQRRLEDVVEKWLRDGDNPSWETLAEAVTLCREGGGKNVGLKIKQKTGLGDTDVLMPLLPILHYCVIFFAEHAKQESARTIVFSSTASEEFIAQSLPVTFSAKPSHHGYILAPNVFSLLHIPH